MRWDEYFRKRSTGLFGFYEKLHGFVVGGEGEGVVGAFLCFFLGLALGFFYFDFLLVGVFLVVVRHVPAQRGKEFVDKVGAYFGFLVFGRAVVGFVGVEIGDELFDGVVGCLKHGCFFAKSDVKERPSEKFSDGFKQAVTPAASAETESRRGCWVRR